MPKPMILTFNFTPDRLSKLRFICLRLGLQAVDVPEPGFYNTLGAICGLSEPNDAEGQRTFAEEMMVFAHMDNALVNRFLQTAKQMRFAPVALKAILTPTNAEWTPGRLCEELKQERAAILKGDTLHD